MGVKPYPQAPYYDDYNESKDFVQILAKAGNYSQSREFTQMGTMYRDYLGRLGDALFSSGQIVSGCQLVVDKNAHTATLSTGSIYVDGLVRKIRTPITIAITCEGTERIGAKISESIITANEDSSLRNPAVGTDGFGSEGGARVKQTISLTLNDDTAATIYKLVDGDVSSEGQTTEDTSSVIDSQLAQRTYDVSGNFKVEGLYLQTKDTTDNTSKVYVGAGRAYILGYYIKHNNIVVKDCEIPTTTRSYQNEPHTCTSYDISYKFNCQPEKEVDQITFECTKTLSITRGAEQGGRDFVVTGLKSISTVMQGTTTYVAGTDYVQSGDYISWQPLGNEPASGTTYQVTCTYYYSAIEGTDYTISGTGSNKALNIVATSTNKPNLNSTMLFDYKFYLSRMDTYTMDSRGNVGVIKGVPEIAEYCKAPRNNDPSLLVLGYVLNYANTTDKKINNINTIRLTQSDIYSLQSRIDDLEYNIAQNDLDREAKEGEDATELKGVFTDGFLGVTKSDIYHAEWDGSIDLDLNEFTVPYDTGYADLSIGSGGQAEPNGRIISAPYTTAVVINQPKATKQMLVNPYQVYKDLTVMDIDPAEDTWTSTDKVTINQEASGPTRYVTLRAYFNHMDQSRQKWYQDAYNQHQALKTQVSTTTTTEVATYMRGRSIKVVGSNFLPNEYPIKIKMLDKDMTPIFPASGTVVTDHGYSFTVNTKGSLQVETIAETLQDGTSTVVGQQYIKADADGKVEFYYVLPDGVLPCGTASVSLVGHVSAATANYVANGTIVTEVTTIRPQKVVINWIDPIAQTFGFENDTVLTGIDLYFAVKSATKGCVVQIRDTVNGYPGQTIYAETGLSSSEVNANPVGLTATHVDFKNTIYCQGGTQYAVCILTDVVDYALWVAEMGGTDITTQTIVNSNPYAEGLLFSSSNGSAWTAHQDMDLTFKLYKATYTGLDTVVLFNQLTGFSATELIAAANVEDLRNDGVKWELALDGTNYKEIDTYAINELENNLGTQASLKATIKCTESRSPIIAKDSVTLYWMKNHLTGTYVSRRIEMSEDFTKLKVNVQFCLPDGCQASVFYQTEDVSSSWIQLTNPTINKEDEEFYRYVYEKTITPAKMYRVKVVLSSQSALSKPRMRKLMSILRY